jgi:hypothetical protein
LTAAGVDTALILGNTQVLWEIMPARHQSRRVCAARRW